MENWVCEKGVRDVREITATGSSSAYAIRFRTREELMKYSIYALVDPRDLHIRYIGQTCDPRARQYKHMCPTSSSASRAVKAWIKELHSIGLAPQLVVFQEVDTRAEALRVENHWIRQFLAEGAALLNTVGRPKRKPMSRRDAALYSWQQRRKRYGYSGVPDPRR
jgi:hypothetical protein